MNMNRFFMAVKIHIVGKSLNMTGKYVSIVKNQKVTITFRT